MTVLTLHESPDGSRRGRSVAAFTLVEVILAIVIALGILVVLLYFYQQATSLREQVLQETERISAARLLMDRITGELRASQADSTLGQGFVGSSNSIQFAKTDVPSFASWMGAPLGRSTFPVTDLKVVSYRLESSDGTNVAGLVRLEEPLIPKQQTTNSDDLLLTNDVPNSITNGPAPPVLGEIQLLQFRYWSGTNWLDSWNSSGVPEAVEVSLGPEAITNETEDVEAPVEIFRRVIYLGGRGLAQSNTTTAAKPEPGEASPAEGAAPPAEGAP
jgi:type II secretory pathway pseudopilin PulG